MATLLVNPKMNPALASRVEASVTGKRGKATAFHAGARLVSRARFVVVVGVVGLIVSFVLSLRRERAELAGSRASLLAQWNEQTVSVTAKDKTFLERVQKVLQGLTGAYSGDVTAVEPRSVGALATLLARPAVYIRGPISAFADSAALAKAATDSGKDALLLCLLDPPPTHDEKSLLTKARLAMAGGAPVQRVTPNVVRLYDAVSGLPILLPPWSDRIKSAKDPQILLKLGRELKKAPVALVKRAVRSEILIAVLDEPNDKGGVTELDGEGTHNVRFAVVELDSAKLLLSIRKQVNPNWITPNRRSQYARDLDGCRLALDVHSAFSETNR